MFSFPIKKNTVRQLNPLLNLTSPIPTLVKNIEENDVINKNDTKPDMKPPDPPPSLHVDRILKPEPYKMGPAMFTLQSICKDIKYPTSNSIFKMEKNTDISEVFTSEVYESCVLSFSIIDIQKGVEVVMKNYKKTYYGLRFEQNACYLIMSDDFEEDIEDIPDDIDISYEIGDMFKIIHLPNEITIFKNQYKIWSSNRIEHDDDSYRAVFRLYDEEDEIGNIQFYFTHFNREKNNIQQGSDILLKTEKTNNIKIRKRNRFYLLKGVSSKITGIVKGKNGQYIILINISGNKQIFMDNMESEEENRFYLGCNKIELKQNETIKFLYVDELRKWVKI